MNLIKTFRQLGKDIRLLNNKISRVVDSTNVYLDNYIKSDGSYRLQDALDDAASKNTGLVFPRNKKIIQSGMLYLKPGITLIDGNHSTLVFTATAASGGFYAPSIHDPITPARDYDRNIENLTIRDLTIEPGDLDKKSNTFTLSPFQFYDASNITIDNCHFTAYLTTGIVFRITDQAIKDSINNTVKNTVVIIKQKYEGLPTESSSPVGDGIGFNVNLQSYTGRLPDGSAKKMDTYWFDHHEIAKPRYVHKNVTVKNNHITSGYYGIMAFFVEDYLISDNVINENMRGISNQNNSCYGVIRNNLINNFVSSAMLFNYGVNHVLCENNRCVSSIARNQGYAHMSVNVNNITVRNNYFETLVPGRGPKWCIYAGVNVHDIVISGNTIKGNALRTVFGIESAWVNPTIANSDGSKPFNNYTMARGSYGYFEGIQKNSWASEDSYNITITNNVVDVDSEAHVLTIQACTDENGNHAVRDVTYSNNRVISRRNGKMVNILTNGQSEISRLVMKDNVYPSGSTDKFTYGDSKLYISGPNEIV